MAQDASLAEQYPELVGLVAKNEAEAEKEKGNKAFSEKRSVFSSVVYAPVLLYRACAAKLLSTAQLTVKLHVLCRHDDAVKHFSSCIRLDPSNEIYYSNRAAAHNALKNFRGALSDGKEVIRLKPRWAKGWARIAAAHFGLEEFEEVGVQPVLAILPAPL